MAKTEKNGADEAAPAEGEVVVLKPGVAKKQSPYVHGANLKQKEGSQKKKYASAEAKKLLAEIRPEYEDWRKANEELKGPTAAPSPKDDEILQKRVELLANYKDFIDQQKYAEAFDSRSNLHSSVLEEFMYYLFKDLVAGFGGKPVIGKSHTFKDLFFFPPAYDQMLKKPNVRVEAKTHDFVIGATVEASLRCAGVAEPEEIPLDVPAVAIECKTYLDKTMLEGSSTAAEQLKFRNPNALYIVVMEWLKLTEDINLRKYKVDQIYVFRKQKNTDREFRFEAGYVKNPIDLGVVKHLFDFVRKHLTSPWGGGVDAGLKRGWLIGP